MPVFVSDPQRPPVTTSSDRDDLAVRRHMMGVWRYLRMLGAAPEQADDLTQDVFVVAFDKGAHHREPPAFASFLRKTARFLWLRRGARSGLPLDPAAVDALWDRDAARDGGDELVGRVQACVGELTERARQAVQLVYGEGRSRADVAAALGMKENGVKTLMQRTRRVLRDCLERRPT